MCLKTKTVKVALPVWSESEKSWFLQTERAENLKGWSGGDWFPKKVCRLKWSDTEKRVGLLTLPLWLFEVKQKQGLKFTNLENKII